MIEFFDIFNAAFELICVLIFMGGISYFISSFIVLIVFGLYKIFFKKQVFHRTQNQIQLLLTTCSTGYLAYDYCCDFYPSLASPVALIAVIVIGSIIGTPEFKLKKKYRSFKIKPSTSIPLSQPRIQTVSFDIAFVSQIGQDPVSYISSKLSNCSDLGAIRYLFEIIEVEIEKKCNCKSPGFDFYYAKAINQKENKSTPSSHCGICSSNPVCHDGTKGHSLTSTSSINDALSVLLPSLLPKEPKVYNPSYGYDTLKGERVKSYDEAVIANMLYRAGIKYEYERLVQLNDHFVRPDFSIPISPDGDMIYWEHCGMLNDPEYRTNWKLKKEAYRTCNIVEGKNLIITHGTEPYVLNRIIADIYTQINKHTRTPLS